MNRRHDMTGKPRGAGCRRRFLLISQVVILALGMTSARAMAQATPTATPTPTVTATPTATPTPTCPSVVQHSIANQNNIGSNSFTSAGTSGNFNLSAITAWDGLIVNVSTSSSSSVVTGITDNLGCALWQVAPLTKHNSGVTGDLEPWFTPYCPGGTITLTVDTAPTEGKLTVAIQEIGSAIGLDAGNSNYGTSNGSTSGSITTTGVNEVALTALIQPVANNPTSKGFGGFPAFALLQNYSSNPPYTWIADSCAAEIRDYEAGFSLSGLTNWTENVAAYYATSTPVGPTPTATASATPTATITATPTMTPSPATPTVTPTATITPTPAPIMLDGKNSGVFTTADAGFVPAFPTSAIAKDCEYVVVCSSMLTPIACVNGGGIWTLLGGMPFPAGNGTMQVLTHQYNAGDAPPTCDQYVAAQGSWHLLSYSGSTCAPGTEPAWLPNNFSNESIAPAITLIANDLQLISYCTSSGATVFGTPSQGTTRNSLNGPGYSGATADNPVTANSVMGPQTIPVAPVSESVGFQMDLQQAPLPAPSATPT